MERSRRIVVQLLGRAGSLGISGAEIEEEKMRMSGGSAMVASSSDGRIQARRRKESKIAKSRLGGAGFHPVVAKAKGR